MDDDEYAARSHRLEEITEESEHARIAKQKQKKQKALFFSCTTLASVFVLCSAFMLGRALLSGNLFKPSESPETSVSSSNGVSAALLSAEVSSSEKSSTESAASESSDGSEIPDNTAGVSEAESEPTPEPTPTPDPEKAGTIFSDEYADLSISEKIDLLREWFPDGKYWNHFGTNITEMSRYQVAMCTSDIPCDNFDDPSMDDWYTGVTGYLFCYGGENTQCLGFAGMISDFLYGEDAGIEVAYDFDDIEVGDHIRLIEYEHSMTVIEKNYDSIKVVECNRDYVDCLIEWDREITRNELNTYVYEVIKRTEEPYDSQEHDFTIYGPWSGDANISYSYDEYYNSDESSDVEDDLSSGDDTAESISDYINDRGRKTR